MNNDDRLPPLTALRAFEAAARHMSFATAAAELHVTPAALSFQIKSLETHLGAPVFIRLNRKVELTEVGAALMPGLAEGFEALQNAWGTALRKLDQGHLTVTAGPAFMTGWLAPRISKFVTAHPELELRLTASLKLLNFQRDGIDIAMRFGPVLAGTDKGYFSEILFQDWATPMIAPELADQIKTPQDIFSETIIRQGSNEILAALERWDDWCKVMGVALPNSKGPYFSTPDSALTSAANGGGIVLGRVSLAEPYLTSGRLVMPFKESIHRGFCYRLVCPLGAEKTPNVMVFREWIKEEIQSLEVFAQDRIFI